MKQFLQRLFKREEPEPEVRTYTNCANPAIMAGMRKQAEEEERKEK